MKLVGYFYRQAENIRQSLHLYGKYSTVGRLTILSFGVLRHQAGKVHLTIPADSIGVDRRNFAHRAGAISSLTLLTTFSKSIR